MGFRPLSIEKRSKNSSPDQNRRIITSKWRTGVERRKRETPTTSQEHILTVRRRRYKEMVTSQDFVKEAINNSSATKLKLKQTKK